MITCVYFNFNAKDKGASWGKVCVPTPKSLGTISMSVSV